MKAHRSTGRLCKGVKPVLLASVYLVLFCLAPAVADTKPHFSAADYLGHIKYLASPELKGRLTGTPELNEAAEYIAAHFAGAHLKPLGSSYFQDFDVTARTGLSDGDRLTLEAKGTHLDLK